MDRMDAHDKEFGALRGRAIELAAAFERTSQARYESGAFIGENIHALRDAGLTRLNVPRALGGPECSLAENKEIVRILSKGCGSTGFAFAIHAILTGGVRQMFESSLSDRVFEAVNSGAFVCGPFTDTNSGGNWLFPSTRARRVDGGYVIDGTKHFFTGFEACTHMIVTAALQDEQGRVTPPVDTLMLFLEKPAGPEAQIVERWDGFAMPMTGSHSVKLTNLFVSEDGLLGPEGLTALLTMPMQSWGHYLFAAIFLGLAERAYELAIERTKGRTNNAIASPLTMMPGVQFAVGDMRGRLLLMNALLDEYCEFHATPGDDIVSFVADTTIPKFVVTNEALEVV
ncbi:MAG: acyl-CoA/acyl-ACP dehydrogenase, partial [Myxococcales bacterium]|nr:acyl-CoA/acyl-ACP dehydrogenase [Myxococcales bacterium]